MSNEIKCIAFYLPQFHPIPENDLWWGKGFTEWTNVGKARPLFKGHEQPKVPADLGYYDLRLEDTRIAQAEMAKKYGIDGFCYYHYWFGNGKRLLEQPFNNVLKSGKPNFPFMLCWANESWHSKFWNIDGRIEKKMLIEQKYEGEYDNELHFYALLEAFKDERYIKINGLPAFMIYKPLDFKNVDKFIIQWNNLAIENGLPGIYFIGQFNHNEDIKEINGKGFNAVNSVRLGEVLWQRSIIEKTFNKIYRQLFHLPYIIKYKKAFKYFTHEVDKAENVFPSLIPNWDHTPRSKSGGFLLKDCTPTLFKKHLDDVFKLLSDKEQKVCFIKSWNEWGEGNYLEPDLKYGLQFLEVFKEMKDKYFLTK